MTSKELRETAQQMRLIAAQLELVADEKDAGSEAPIKLGQIVKFRSNPSIAGPGKPYFSCGDWYIEANGSSAKAHYWITEDGE